MEPRGAEGRDLATNYEATPPEAGRRLVYLSNPLPVFRVEDLEISNSNWTWGHVCQVFMLACWAQHFWSRISMSNSSSFKARLLNNLDVLKSPHFKMAEWDRGTWKFNKWTVVSQAQGFSHPAVHRSVVCGAAWLLWCSRSSPAIWMGNPANQCVSACMCAFLCVWVFFFLKKNKDGLVLPERWSTSCCLENSATPAAHSSYFFLLCWDRLRCNFFFKLIHLCSFSTKLQEMHKTFQTVDFVAGFLRFERTKTDKPTCTHLGRCSTLNLKIVVIA